MDNNNTPAYAYLQSGDGGDSTALEYVLRDRDNCIVMASFYERSAATVRAVGACFHAKYASFVLKPELGSDRSYMRKTLRTVFDTDYDVFVTSVENEMDMFYHCVVYSREIGQRYYLTTAEDLSAGLYSLLMNRFDLPLLLEWMPALYSELAMSGYVYTEREQFAGLYCGNATVPVNGVDIPVEQVVVQKVELQPEQLDAAVKKLLQNGKIRIADAAQGDLGLTDMNAYFEKYGSSIVENLSSQMHPLTELSGEVDDFTLKHKRLYPQQAATMHGAKALLRGVGNKKERRRTSAKYCILNGGMGIGKTIQAVAIMEAIGVAAEMNRSGKSLHDIYMEPDNVKYRNLVMCPGHLVQKWADEIKTEVPYAKVEIITGLDQLEQIRKNGRERTGREFYVIGKDKAKLSFSKIPTPVKVREGYLYKKVCLNSRCRRSFYLGDTCECGSTRFRMEKISAGKDTGLVCPTCNKILLSKRKMAGGELSITLMPEDFKAESADNRYCMYCGEGLWKPFVPNLTIPGQKKKGTPWKRITHYVNKAHKGTKTVWVHDDYYYSYLQSIGEKEEDVHQCPTQGLRRFAPGAFIKSHLKGFFDVAVFDEVHTLKGGNTAQGNTMHALIKASKRQLALTGTIAGGMATDLFYLLYRLDPRRMQERGFSWRSQMRFAEEYGCIDTEYAVDDKGRGEYNVCSRGKQISSPTCKPGISPLIYTDFLLDRTVFLDITDMSKYLPALTETVVTVPADPAVKSSYDSVVDTLNALSRTMGMAMLSNMLQFSLSYLDKPYDREPIKDPFIGTDIVVPDSYDKYKTCLLPKEAKLVELVNKELAEGRNCFVYAEYTATPETCVSYRLKDVLQKGCKLKDNEVVILESTSPKTAEREAWIHKKAAEGAKVFITNPKCVETGRALASVA